MHAQREHGLARVRDDGADVEMLPVTPKAGLHLSPESRIGDLLRHPAFQGYARLLLPWDDRSYDEGMRLSELGSLLPYHSLVDPRVVVTGLNRIIDDVNTGRQVFHAFYTEEQQRRDPTKRRTGLFFFHGKSVAPFAIVSPGGGFAYVASVHEGFPHAAAISHAGYNVFVLKYREGLGGSSATSRLTADEKCHPCRRSDLSPLSPVAWSSAWSVLTEFVADRDTGGCARRFGAVSLCQNCARTIGKHRPSPVAIGRGRSPEDVRSQHIVSVTDPWSRTWTSIQLPVLVEQRDGGGAERSVVMTGRSWGAPWQPQ